MTSPSTERDPIPAFVDRLICVVGVGRSGTTVLKSALGAHPQLLAAQYEAPLERAIAAAYGQHLTQTPEFAQYVRNTSEASWDNVRSSFKRLIVSAALSAEQFGESNPRHLAGWVIKVGGLWQPSIVGFRELFAQFTPVFVHRNGIDVVESRRKFGTFADQAFETSCAKWAAGLPLLERLRDELPVHVVAHQQLIEAPEAAMEELLTGIGLEVHPGPATHLLNRSPNSTQETDEALSVAENFARRPPGHADWTAEQKATFVTICGAAMESLGYDIPFA